MSTLTVTGWLSIDRYENHFFLFNSLLSMLEYLRQLSGKERNVKINYQLALFLVFITGVVNTNGLIAVEQYTAHMSGIVAKMAGNLMIGETQLIVTGLSALFMFVAGSICSTMLVNWSRQRNRQGEYAFPLILEAGLLLLFGLLGDFVKEVEWLFIPVTVSLLCFVMGLQNAVMTKMSDSKIRTTHMTGFITDLGIELGQQFYWRIAQQQPGQLARSPDRKKLWSITSLLSAFFVGGAVGTLGFYYLGSTFILLPAILLAALAIVPVIDDLGLFHGIRK